MNEHHGIWVNSGDSHVLEPSDLWKDLPRSFRDRAPRTVQEGDREVVYIDGSVVRRDPLAWLETFRPPGAHDLSARMVDLNEQGIWAEAVFPSTGIWVTYIEDSELYSACARGYNEWCASELNAFSERLVGVAILPALSVEDAVAELHRCVEQDFKAVSLPISPPEYRPYNSAEWDPLWAALQEAGIPLCLHAGTGRNATSARGAGGAIINYVEVSLGAQRVVTDMVAGGALDRHPDLRIFVAEVGASWLPWLGDRMDEAYRQHGFFVRPKLSRLPSQQIRYQVYSSFQNDRSAVQAAAHMDLHTVMWGSDYPHLEGTYPRTQEVIHELFADVAPALRERILIGAFTELFDVPPPPATHLSAPDDREVIRT